MIATVADPSQAAAARRNAVELARTRGLDEAARGRVALVATEMAANLIKHAGQGEIVIAGFADRDGAGVELLSLDRGPGIADLGRALTDGFSTAGSPGNGLGAIRRQADNFAIWSRPGLGVVAMARFCAGPGSGEIRLGAVAEPFPGERVSGDCWDVALAAGGPTLMMTDGTGHGVVAILAADAAAKAFKGHFNDDPVRIMDAIHRALAPTRGAAVAIARVDARQAIVRFVGVGNIAGALVDEGGTRRMISHNGTVGHIAPRIREFTYPWSGGGAVIFHSDGLSAKWDLAAYPGLGTSHPSLIAGVLFRDFRRGRDDASVVAMETKPL
jgi:anti-sigma regulatory factor (Ser/Thr protein kinase)